MPRPCQYPGASCPASLRQAASFERSHTCSRGLDLAGIPDRVRQRHRTQATPSSTGHQATQTSKTETKPQTGEQHRTRASPADCESLRQQGYEKDWLGAPPRAQLKPRSFGPLRLFHAVWADTLTQQALNEPTRHAQRGKADTRQARRAIRQQGRNKTAGAP